MPCLQAGDCWRGGLAEDLPELVVRGLDALKGEEASQNWFYIPGGGAALGLLCLQWAKNAQRRVGKIVSMPRFHVYPG